MTKFVDKNNCSSVSNYQSVFVLNSNFRQARYQLGTPGGAKSFPRGAQIFWTMSNIIKLCPTHFSSGAKSFSMGLRPPGYGPAFRASLSDFRKLNFLLTVLSERHFRIFATFSIFSSQQWERGLHKWISLGPHISQIRPWKPDENFGWVKTFDFRRATVFCLRYSLLKHRMTRYSKKIGRAVAPFPPCLRLRTYGWYNVYAV